jgi:hypothetical protein
VISNRAPVPGTPASWIQRLGNIQYFTRKEEAYTSVAAISAFEDTGFSLVRDTDGIILDGQDPAIPFFVETESRSR